ncbi:MAG: hypothetical protein TR69_WS6001000281 [candidate division WS6 bacterium OLB20]|uniref:Fibronectin type-III domain-containing protein n=1 Tax=candidate division WS6 bacterium OLB20 TaxID=1617426 RepID=A0A136M0I2_9BACT|nr:MAG: hypothetical protein TR69_WS6001000281 [candidate division WS6 bacterium OLB20]
MNKKNRTFLSLILVAVIAASIPLTLGILQSGNLDIRISAFESDRPANIIISSQTATSVLVTWTTEKAVTGGIVLDGKPFVEEGPSTSHAVTLPDLNAGTEYAFTITSDGVTYPEDGSTYRAKTATRDITSRDNFLVYGQVFSKDGVTFQQSGIVVIELLNGDSRSQRRAARINESGGYQLNLANLLDDSLDEVFSFRSTADVLITVYTPDSTEPVTKRFTQDLRSFRQLPSVYLGDAGIDIIPGIDGEI